MQEDTSLSGASKGEFRGGSSITLDVKDFPYAYYTNTIVKKISQSWTWSDTFGNLKTLVFFRIQNDGSLSEISVNKPSGDGYFDQQALRAVTLASPFPPLPAGYKENSLGVYFEFFYSE
ncbi:energy transducer TonB [Elusimicrobiota bacterium]